MMAMFDNRKSGAAYLAGLGSGVRGSTDELLLLRQAQRSYKPAMGEERRKECLDGWSKSK